MRIWIAAFLLCLFACQALPVVALGKSIVKVGLSAPDDAGDDDGDSIPGKAKKQSPLQEEDYVRAHGADLLFCDLQAMREISLHRPDHLPVLYAGEVTSPPPDCC